MYSSVVTINTSIVHNWDNILLREFSEKTAVSIDFMGYNIFIYYSNEKIYAIITPFVNLFVSGQIIDNQGCAVYTDKNIKINALALASEILDEIRYLTYENIPFIDEDLSN